MTLDEILARYEPALRNAFIRALQEVADNAQVGQIIAALERGDINSAVEAVFLDRGAYAEFERLLAEAYGEGGAGLIEEFGQLRDEEGVRFILRFNPRNLRAERWLQDHSSRLITGTIEDQRNAVRQNLQSGMRAGDNPRKVALDVTGRVNRTTGRREGGIVGLSAAQQRAVEKARQELENGQYGTYRQRERRDKRFDRTIARAEREERPLTNVEISRMLGRYTDRLKALRGETISRTEMLASLNHARHEAALQLVDSGKVRAEQIRRVWDSAGDSRVRFSHAVMDGQSVGLNERFQSPRGAQLLYPGDTSAPAEEVINCRCSVNVRIDFRPNR